ncbi:TonB-dependent receptor plug domain-containing protein [Pseudoduganella sp. UC29_106]|uniref:TonB-dependent receptor plug domain-containing protein n=1 Tax=Pseudoduganella sp. UC29_106 TaxID=3374553 RepID=UPI003757FE6F
MAAGAPALAAGQQAPADDDKVVTLDNVTVTSRNREELAQDVPVPVSVVSGATLERDNVVGIAGLTQKVPNLGLFGSNPRQTSISLRGIGKNTANDTMEPSVGVIVDGVASSYVGQNWTDWVDLDRIEVIRGPQGTLLARTPPWASSISRPRRPASRRATPMKPASAATTTWKARSPPRARSRMACWPIAAPSSSTRRMAY